jgi:amino acid adenylation domain-containing protein/non-ribosomal peptide synthase protein (TIGR01720 family)
MTDLTQQLAKLSPEKQQLLLRRLQAKQSGKSLQPIPRWAAQADYPLSFAQQRLWFLQQFDPQSTNYHIPGALRLQGELDVAALQHSLQSIVQRHDSLRANFVASAAGEARQGIQTTAPEPLPLVDLQQLEPTDRDAAAQRIIAQINDTPFDLTTDPLLRMQLLQLDSHEHLLVFCMHHIVSDGWSMGILTRELAAFYTATIYRKPVDLPELTIQYTDFAQWQRQQLRGELHQQQLDYWQQQLSGLPPRLELQTDRPRPTVQTLAGEQAVFLLDASLSKALNKLSQETGTTLFMTLLAAFQVLLYRYTGQPDLAVGSPIANRNRPEIENLIGFFVNTLVLRSDLSGQPTFRELLARVQAVALNAYQHQDMPFDLVVEAVQPERDLSYSPLFQVMFVLQNAGGGELQLPNLSLSPVNSANYTAKFDITLSIDQGDDCLSCAWEYNTDLFDRSTIVGMHEHFHNLLQAIVSNPDCQIEQLQFLHSSELEQLACLSHSGHSGSGHDLCLHEFFERQVATHPNAIAIVEGDRQLSYQALNQQANQLAHYLQSLGVKPETLVGIFLERSIDLIICMVAIIKAGGAYVPLDPAYPSDRLALILADTELSIIFTTTDLLSQLPTTTAQTIVLDRDQQLWGNTGEHNPHPAITPENLAYIIYTSGSTGVPKGVMIPQQGITRLVLDTNYVELTNLDRIAQASNTAFDAATFEIWGALLNGAQLVVISSAILLSPPDLATTLQAQEITTLFLTPALFNQMASLVPTAFKNLRYLIMGGEALDPQWVRVVLAAGAPQHLLNGYGPTECTTFATYYEVTELSPHATTIPIGRPLSQTEVYILDVAGQQVPLGVPGELHIGGNGLAQGYWQRPELTAEKFIPHLYSDRPDHDARLYKTGDLGRYLPNGDIEYLGRIDQQVKIRGFRIELGEIETVLSQHPQVRQASVQARTSESGQKQLVAYLVLELGLELNQSELRQFLAARLPDYMIPWVFVTLDEIPLTPNGKVDRRALPEPELITGSYTAPQTPTEQKLATIWSEVLGLNQVGINDNFFAIGGDSILSLQIIARANQIGIKLTPKQLFAHQTIIELAKVAGTSVTVVAEQGIIRGGVPFTPIQQWFLAQDLPDLHHFNQSVLLQLPVDVNADLLQRVLVAVYSHHDALRLQFKCSDSLWQQYNLGLELMPQIQTVDLSAELAAEQSVRLTEICSQHQASIDLTSGCLLQATLFQMGEGQPQRLLIAIHHLAVDGVSWRILLADIQTAYQQLSQGQAITLPAKTTSWREWAQQLTNVAADFYPELSYWQAQGSEQIQSLPIDHAGENTVASEATVSVALSAAATQNLLQRVPAIYRTQINDLLLAAVVQTISDWTGDSTVQLDLEGHGREALFANVDISRTVGWFTTMFPLCLQVPAISHPGLWIKSTKEQLRAIPQKGIGYGLLRYVWQEPSLIKQIPAPIGFNYLGQFDQVMETEGDFQLANESTGADRSLQGNRQHLLEIGALIAAGQLQFNWSYSKNVYNSQTIEQLAQNLIANLEVFIDHCLQPTAGGYTPSDFPLVQLSQSDLDRLIGQQWRQVQDLYPLSPMQQGLLFHSLSTPESGVYMVQVQCTLQGSLNYEIFGQAWQRVVDRYDIFRTGFIGAELATPLQCVYHHVPLIVQAHDWQQQEPDQQQLELAKMVRQERQQSFDLRQPPLMRLQLIQLAGETYELIWTHHHLLLDGWSLPLVLKEVFTAYQAIEQGEPLATTVSTPFRSYIAWLQAQDLRAARDFWQSQLQGFNAPTPLIAPVDRSQLGVGYQLVQRRLSTAETASLQSFIRQHQLTLNNLVQGAWALLLSRYSGNVDVVFGATVSGRPAMLAGVEEIVGLFINTLPVRVTMSPSTPVLTWLQALQQQQQEIDQYAYTPLAEVQGWSDVPRGLALFDSIVVFENYPMGDVVKEHPAANDLQISNVQSTEQTNYPLSLIVVPGSILSLDINYDSSRFASETINQMLDHLQQLLLSLAQHADGSLQQITLLDDHTQQLLLQQAIAPTVIYPADRDISEQLIDQAQQSLQAVAVICDDQQLTYGALAKQVDSLAQQLSQRGVQAGTVVGLCVPRSISMVVGILAILRAGGVYLPLDSEYPLARRQFMVKDAGVSILVGNRSCLPPELVGELPCLELAEALTLQHHGELTLPLIAPTDPAYILYTSGSTGQPKGVVVDRQTLLAHCWGMVDYYQFQSSDRVLQFASLNFDPSLEQLLPALLTGCGVVLRGERVWSATELLDQLATHSVTVVNLPTAYWRQTITAWQSAGVTVPAVLRLMIVGGEALLPSDLAPWQSVKKTVTPVVQLINAYGPTETTITALTFDVPDDFAGDRLPIGRPLPNRRAYILDLQGQLCPLGIPGELHLGGAGLAQGYYQQPELTAAKFILDPFQPEIAGRMYRTGDLARYLPTGDIEYLGRIDEQVKIRGFRVELAEIATALAHHPALQDNTLQVYSPVAGQQRLVAYYVLHDTCEKELDLAAELRQFLAISLPEYMVPSTFVRLDHLPLTPSGKVDRRALPDPLLGHDSTAITLPSTPMEMALAQIWQEALGIPQVGLHDNFFALGGDSILSLQIIARANQAGIQLTFKELFAHPSIGELAQVVSWGQSILAEQGMITGTAPLTPIQSWFFAQPLIDRHHYNQAVLLEVPADLDADRLQQVFSAIIRHHDALRLQFHYSNQNWLQMNAPYNDLLQLQIVDLSTWTGAAQTAQLTAICSQHQASLDLGAGCLLGTTLFQMGTGQPQRLLIAIHHLAVDGVSWRIILDDIQTAYQQLSQGLEISLPAKTTPWQQWAQQLTTAAPDFIMELDYWQTQGQPTVLPLPLDRNGENTMISSESVVVTLSIEATQALLQRVPQVYRTQINDLLLAALAQTMGEWASTTTIQVDLEGHGREELFAELDISRTVGWFTTMFPVCLCLPTDLQPEMVIKHIKEQLRQIPHKGIGYGLLRYICQEPSLVHLPAAPISFNYLGQFDQTLDAASDFQLAGESVGADRSQQGQRQHLLDVSGLIVAGQLQMNWSYSGNQFDRQTIEQLAQCFNDHLVALINHCLEPEVGGYTPSDFPLANLTQTELDRVVDSNWRAIADIYPLSPMQQGMLFHTLYAPEAGMYVELVQCTLQGDLNREIFQQAWQQVIDRYDIFRTGFLWSELSTSVQVVHHQVTVPLCFLDWQGQDAQQQQQQIAVLVNGEARGFDLSCPPLMRLHLIQLTTDTYEFIWSSHHLLLDGWSLPLVFKEVFASYHAYEQGQSPQFTTPPAYRSYIAWLQTQDMSAAKVFWQQQLRGITAPTPLIAPTDLQGLASGSDAVNQTFSADSTAVIQSFVRHHRLTINNLIQGVWALLLSRYSRETDVVFGVTVSGRPATLPGVEEIVGLFINTLPLRVTVPSETNLTIAAWLQSLQKQQQEIDQYAYSPLVEVQGWSEIDRGTALFESIVVFENYPMGEAVSEQPGTNDLQITNVRSIEQTNYPLTLTAIPGQELTVEITYSRSRFVQETIERMLAHFQQLLLAIVQDNYPGNWTALPLLSPTEQEQLLSQAIAPSLTYSDASTIPHLFALQAAKTPQSIALICDDEQLTYVAVADRVQALAQQLRQLGIQPHQVVGLCVHRSLDMAIGLLAIMQAGGVYLPLDPENPSERLQFICADASVMILVGHRSCLASEWVAELPCLYLDEPSDNKISVVTAVTVPQITPTAPAYMLYTSGSTGKPKGVLVDHQALADHCWGIIDHYELQPSDRVLQFAACTFDPALEQLLPALLTGSGVVVRGEQIWSAAELWQQMETQGVTVADLPTAYWRQLIPTWLQDNRVLPTNLRLLIVGGEALLPADLPAWYALQTVSDRQISLVNAYGPTEATITALTYTVPANFQGERLPIGRPLANRRAYILDPYGQLCPIGVPGELCLGGVGLAMGYYQQPLLTAEQFVADPFHPDPQARIYCSGDLARYLPDGQIEYWGRIDQQVKIRGFRVELAEIESVLGNYPAIQAAVVNTYQITPGHQRLVAYYLCQPLQTVTNTELQQFLANQLPEYMVPTVLIQIEALPLNSGGKIDRQALPLPTTSTTPAISLVLPTTPTEMAIAQIWQEVLGVSSVGVHDNFFAIGGDSILSLQIIARANQAGINLTFKQLFSHPTISELAQVAGSGLVVQADQGIVTGIVPFTPIQRWFLSQGFLAPHHYNQAILLSVPTDLAVDLLQQALNQIISHHDALRLQFILDCEDWQQTNSPLLTMPQLQMFDVSDLTGDRQTAKLSELCNQQQAKLDLASGCLLQATLFYLGAGQTQRLLVVGHHLVVDGVSWRIILDDIQTVYQQLTQGLEIALPAKTTSWKQWAQQLTTASEGFVTELDYWQHQTPDQPLPIDRQGDNSVESSAAISVALSVESTQSLLRQVPAVYHTQINDVLLAALAQTVSNWTGSATVQFDLEGHGREELFADIDVSRTVGWFTTMFPVCLHVPEQLQPGLLLKSVKEQLRQIPRKGIGYGLLRYVCQEFQLTQQPAAQISFNYLGQFDQALDEKSDFQFAPESAGLTQDDREQRQHLLDINALVSAGQLQVDWSYSNNLFDRQAIEQLANDFLQNLQGLIDHCLEPTAGGYTPSDFPLATLSQGELDQLMGEQWQQVADIYPLSPMQQGMLFHTVYAPDSGVYVELVNCTLQGDLSPTIFQQAWQQVIDRYDIFRTGFAWGNLSEPLQLLYHKVALPFILQDWQGDERSEQLTKLAALLEQERQQGFDLAAPPLMRLHLIQLANDTYEFVWSSHHLLLDGWSLPLVFKEVFGAYHAYEKGQYEQGDIAAIEPVTPYRNYIAWLQSQDLNAATVFWQQQLQGITAPTPLITALDRSALVAGHHTIKLQLPLGTSQVLQNFARQHQLTLSNLVQGAWALLLSRYSSENDVVFGVTVSGRPPTLPGVEEMVGLFINTIPCRVTLAETDLLLPWLKSIQSQQIASEQYAYTPLVKIQAASDVPQGMPLFESIVVFENYPISTTANSSADGVEIVAIDSYEQTNYPLTLVAVMESELLLKLSYDTSRFTADLIERLLDHCQNLLLGIATHPDCQIHQLPLLTQSEIQFMDQWQHSSSYPTELCLHQKFEEQAARCPDEIAVVCGTERWSYGELNQRANQVAHHLRSLGVTAEVLVGLCVERSLDTILGILAILKAGGAYVPLDPDYPTERLEFMASDAQLSVILTQSICLANCPQQTATIVVIDQDWTIISAQPTTNPEAHTTPENLAYIIYTSGSTGQPKGVLVTHHNVMRLFASTQDNYQFSDRDVWTMFHSYAFDFSVWEVWGALLYGGRLVVVPFWVSRNLQVFSELLLQEQVTVLNQTPSAFMRLMQEPALANSPDPLPLRWVIFGGEALDIPSLQPWFDQYGDQSPQLVNMYGITETTVHVTYRPITQVDVVTAKGSEIGRPIGDLQIYVLDPHLQRLPVGIAGEMYIGGDGLARGYLNRPELTAERFILNPFQADGLLYRSGDLAKLLPNGELEYLGRIDHQVKIRGFRIELGEIEAILSQHPAIMQTVVVARSHESGQQQLVAYLVAKPEIQPAIAELREFLGSRLPDYMIPASFVLLPELPLTTNGKIDKKALPAPDMSASLAVSYVAPQTGMERQLAQIWSDVLGLPQIGIHDNFFAIGGDSILSLQIVARANQAGIQVTPKQLFSYQSIGELAKVAGTGPAIQAEQGIVTGLAPLTPIQHWFFDQDLPAPHHFNLSMLLRVPADLSPDHLQTALKAIISHHDALRLAFTTTEQAWQQQHTPLTELPRLQVENLGHLIGDAQNSRLSEICSQQQASLDLESGCLFSAMLLNMGVGQPQRLFLVVHHLAVDMVSWRILLDDIQMAYQQVSTGLPISLPAKTSSWQQWSQQLTTQTTDFMAELPYWQQQVDRQIPALPLDYQSGDNTVASMATISLTLSTTATADLLRRVPTVYRTQINDLLLAALAQTIGKWTGDSRVYLDLEGHGREELSESVDISRTVGWFTTIFPVCLTLPPHQQPDVLIKSIKEQLRAIPKKGIGYGILRYLQADPVLSGQPNATISFNYLGQFDQTLEAQGEFQMAEEPAGATQDLQGMRHHQIDVNGLITDGQLQLDWTYSTNLHSHQTIEQLAQQFMHNLAALITHCLEPEAGGYTPSDFPLAKLTQPTLDKILGDNWREIADIYPLSPMQQGMLFHSLYAPDSGVYVEVFHCTLEGSLDISSFCQAWQRVIDRYEVFRTGFIWNNLAEPLQYVRHQVTLPFTYYDWQHLDTQQQQQQIATLLTAQQQDFDLTQSPLMRLSLIQLATSTYDLIWTHHHLLLDGWSLPLVFKEIFADSTENISPPIPYRNYIAWLQNQDLNAAKKFWKDQLEGITAPTLLLNIPIEAPAIINGYQTLERHLSVEITTSIQGFVRQHQLTVNNLIQGAWAILLSRYSGECDVVFGVTVSGRPPALLGVEEIVGLFINTLPMRVAISSDHEIVPWLQALQAQQQAIDQYSYTPLIEIQGWSEVPRGENLFDSIVVFENYPIGSAVNDQTAPSNDLQITNVHMEEQTNYPLSLTAIPGAMLTLELSFDRGKFTITTIEHMFDHLQNLLTGMVEKAGQPLGQLSLLTSEQQLLILLSGQGLRQTYPSQCLHQLIEAQATAQPNALAVVWGDQHLTYQELNDQANQLAYYLQSQAVTGRVGIYLERSGLTLVAVLAVLKVSATYLPLDSSYPIERLAYMVANAAIGCLITTASLASQLSAPTTLVVDLDRDGAAIASHSSQNLNLLIDPEQLAYVIYTSGSTGTPKGVMVSHRNLVNAFYGWESAYQLQNTRSHLQMASFSFDVFAGDYIRALASGAKLVICPRDYLLEPALLYKLIQQEQIDCAEFVPAVMRPLADYLIHTNQDLAQMRILVVGSDSWYVQEYQQWQQLCSSHTRLINSYGVSEATIDSCYFETTAIDSYPNQALVPIGKPFQNINLYVLDAQLQPVPTGVTGELYIGGAGISQGYDKRLDLTAAQFIADPFSSSVVAKLYKTGDSARYLADGNLEYLGRIDHQVKIRGFRIELGEVESKLGQHPQVSQAVVDVRSSTSGQQHLVAYLVTTPPEPPTTSEFRHFLATSLPDYMLPSVFVMVSEFPLTPNGKIDRRALPEPNESNLITVANFVPPTNFVEQQLAEIWSAVLECYPISTQANFFDLGGHSLLAIQLMAQVQQQFDRQLPLATLFQYPTIAEMATMLWHPSAEVAWSSLVPIRPHGDQEPFFCIPGAGGNPIYLHNLAHYLDQDRPFYSFQSLGLDGEAQPHQTVVEIARDYLQAMQTVQPNGPYYLGGHSFGGLVALEIALQLQQQGETVACLAIIDSGAPDLGDVPPLEMDEADWVYTMVTIVEGMYGQTLDVDLEKLRALDSAAQLVYFQSQLQAAQLLPAGMGITQIKGLIAVYKAQAAMPYRPLEKYHGKITFLHASEEEDGSDGTDAALHLGWEHFTSQSVVMYLVPGNHYTMMRPPHVTALSAQLNAIFDLNDD